MDYIDELYYFQQHKEKLEQERKEREQRKAAEKRRKLTQLEKEINLIIEFRDDPDTAEKWIRFLFPAKTHKQAEWLENMT